MSGSVRLVVVESRLADERVSSEVTFAVHVGSFASVGSPVIVQVVQVVNVGSVPLVVVVEVWLEVFR